MNNFIDNLKELSEINQVKYNDLKSIISDMDLGEEYNICGLLYLHMKEGNLTLDDIKSSCNDFTYQILKTLDKLNKINFSQQSEEAENLRRMFFAITKDIRIIMLKIALVTTELRHIDKSNNEYNLALAHSIFTLYAPLSARLGLMTYKTELEEGAFIIEQPELRQQIQDEVDNRFHKRQPIVNRLTTLVENCLTDLNIKGKVYGRKKHIYSIYKKLDSHTLDNIYDLIAVRAIVETVADCYALLGRLHSILEPMESRFKDYIATPKPNGYQSLHTTVIFEGFPVEIQIRSEDMHKYAEYGIAAHWLYKEKKSKQDNLDTRLAWLRQMMEDEDSSIDELADSLSQDIYNNDIFVQTPKGKVIYLPMNSTPIDFAYIIHSEVGNKCVGAKVNGKMVPVNSTLNNGDIVEIITNPKSKGPSRDWLKICKTSEARNKINTFFKKNMKEENIKLGKSMLESAIRAKGYSATKLLTEENIQECLSYYSMAEDELYASIGANSMSSKLVSGRLISIHDRKIKAEENKTQENTTISLSVPSDKHIAIKGLNNILVKFANCCHPMYGDKIVGFVSAGRGVIIHRDICPNVQYFKSSRLIEASWKDIAQPNKKKK
ncbi:MAG: bifunctional (p)ppGpp synthetase/guanosine-3',5'-bis(diphosphate) 3'-pyrophosphohydrolase [Clostridia bacterium]|nr:bifunctional (p)ppGpp synthetase/guanosine-3',5'-bis(diphosphate) 3'-pyrophosphohydrolase [Clostridia bacterium]